MKKKKRKHLQKLILLAFLLTPSICFSQSPLSPQTTNDIYWHNNPATAYYYQGIKVMDETKKEVSFNDYETATALFAMAIKGKFINALIYYKIGYCYSELLISKKIS